MLSAFCLPLFVLMGVAARIGVTGITGTAGVIVEEAVRDIGRELGRESESSTTALGMAGAVKPGGMVGVARRGCSKKWVLNGVFGVPRICSFSLSFTSASTLKDACSSALNGVSSVYDCQHSIYLLFWINIRDVSEREADRLNCNDDSGRQSIIEYGNAGKQLGTSGCKTVSLKHLRHLKEAEG